MLRGSYPGTLIIGATSAVLLVHVSALATTDIGAVYAPEAAVSVVLLLLVMCVLGGSLSRDRAKMEEQVRSASNLALTDHLTGLDNRRHFELILDRSLSRRRRTGEDFALVMIDLNDFKGINDRYGHPAGDLVLKVASQRLRDSLREIDTLARFGGDEFAIIVANIDDCLDLDSLLQRLHSQFEEEIEITGLSLTISISHGIAISSQAETAADLLRAVDENLYAFENMMKKNPDMAKKAAARC